ncbi:hypothetical protein EVAR_49221_1 [Eumeta japonica]|uniref:Uncharacterized protein n=1 Tax=Eumeta variegata TaxID=151549 RepID=A0A4C1XRW4_EUMVA|nr:hypothetical protein EVAR_49221_1 [Eumeta japonica]
MRRGGPLASTKRRRRVAFDWRVGPQRRRRALALVPVVHSPFPYLMPLHHASHVHHHSPPSITYLIPVQGLSNALVTHMGLRMSIGSVEFKKPTRTSVWVIAYCGGLSTLTISRTKESIENSALDDVVFNVANRCPSDGSSDLKKHHGGFKRYNSEGKTPNIFRSIDNYEACDGRHETAKKSATAIRAGALSSRKPAPRIASLHERTLLSVVGGFLAVWRRSIMDSVFFQTSLFSRALQCDGWLATVSDAPLHCIL